MSAVQAGVDGLTHVFMDRPHTPEVVAALAAANAFVVRVHRARRVDDGAHRGGRSPRTRGSRRAWTRPGSPTLRSSIARYPAGNLDDVLASVAALHAAGVDLLVGSDASVPVPYLGGVAHGASVHHELQLLVRAGLTPGRGAAGRHLRAGSPVRARRPRPDRPRPARRPPAGRRRPDHRHRRHVGAAHRLARGASHGPSDPTRPRSHRPAPGGGTLASYRSTLAPMTTVRSGGRWNASARLAALRDIQTKSRARQLRRWGAPATCTVRTDRK